MDFVVHLIKFNAQTTGRDRLCRIAQYTSKFLKWYLLKHNMNAAEKFQSLENSLGMTRKAIRIGRSLDMLQGALNNIRIQDKIIRISLVIAKISQACYLFVDHFVWAAKLGIFKADSKKLNQLAARFWLISILASILRNLYDLTTIIRTERNKREKVKNQRKLVNSTQDVAAANSWSLSDNSRIMSQVISNRPVIVDTIKNAADLFLPLSTLEYIGVSEGIQGLMGMISSYMGILSTWDPALKLSPS